MDITNEALQPMDSGELDFSSPGVRKAIRDMIQSKAAASAPEAFNRLLEIADSKNERVALNAIKLLMQMGGMLLNRSQVDFRVSFDDLRKRETPATDPLANLFEIKGEVIEAEIKAEVTDDFDEWERES